MTDNAATFPTPSDSLIKKLRGTKGVIVDNLGYFEEQSIYEPQQDVAPTLKNVIFFQHGLLDSSYSWIENGENSLPFLALKGGYDVWLGNFRGNYYSTEELSGTSIGYGRDYWTYDVSDYALTDMPAMFNYILENTGGTKKISFVGHSLANLALLWLETE